MGGKDDGKNSTADKYVYSFDDDSSDTDTDTDRSTRRRRRMESPEAELERRREKLNNDVAKELGLETDGRNPLNVAIIGCPGVGKSSTINTFMTAMNKDKYREYAISGHFGGQGHQVTYLTKSFPKRCFTAPVHPDACYPTFVDIAGFDNVNNDLTRELLRIVFYGRLPEEDSLKNAVEVYNNTGMNGLREKYSQNLELLKIDRIIVVASAAEEVPVGLIECVISAANPVGAKAGKGKRAIPVFGILTKVDGVDLESSSFKEREKYFLECLGLVGAKQRYARLSNYCSHVDEADERLESYLPKIDVPALKFLRQIIDPVYEVQAGNERFTDTFAVKDSTPRKVETIPAPPSPASPSPAPPSPTPVPDQPIGPHSSPLVLLVMYAIKGIIIALFVNVCLAPSISSTDLLDICTNYDQHRLQYNPGGFENVNLNNICNRKMAIAGRSLMVPLMVFVFLIVLMDFLLPSFIKTLIGKHQKPKQD